MDLSNEKLIATTDVKETPDANLTSLQSLSPSNIKTIGIKLSPTPRPSTDALVTPNTSAAAGTASFEFNSSLNKFPTDPELDFNAIAMDSQKGITNLEKSENPFAGLRECVKPVISELPYALDRDAEEQLKMKFEEGLIPTLTANVVTGFTAKDIVSKREMLSPKEIDTAVSSDNETFAECLSYPEIVSYSQDMPSDEQFMDNSEIETYCSALNSNNTTVNLGNTEDPLQTTYRNMSEFDVESALLSNNATQQLDKTTTATLNATFEGEPMDVDMNSTLDIQDAVNMQKMNNSIADSTKSVGSPAETTDSGLHIVDLANAGIDLDSLNTANVVDNVAVGGNVVQAFRNSKTGRSTYSIAMFADDNVAKDAQPPLIPSIDIQQTQQESSLNNVASTTTLTSQNSNEGIIQDNSIDSASDALAAINTAIDTTVDTAKICKSSENVAHEISTSAIDAEEVSPTKNMSSSTKSLPNTTECKSNASSDMTNSFSSTKSSSSLPSPTFPIRQKMELKQFPRSPSAAGKEREMKFLEKSEYAERINASRKSTGRTYAVQGKTSPSPPPPCEGTTEKLNETIDICTDFLMKSAAIAPQNSNSAVLNATFVNGPESSITTANELQIENNNKRRTFCVPEEESLANASTTHMNLSDIEKRRTFTVDLSLNENAAAVADTHDSIEEMDVDVTMPLAQEDEIEKSSEIGSDSPPTTTLQKGAVKDASFEMTNRPGSPPIPTLQRSISREADLSMTARSGSPPIPTLQKSAAQNASFEMINRPDSPPIPTLRKSISREADVGNTTKSSSPPMQTLQKGAVRNASFENINRPVSPPIPTLQRSISREADMGSTTRSTSPPIPTLQKGAVGNASFENINRPVSPPIPTLQRSISREADLGNTTRSSSPPIPTLQKGAVKDASFEMPNRAGSPSIPKLQRPENRKTDVKNSKLRFSPSPGFKKPTKKNTSGGNIPKSISPPIATFKKSMSPETAVDMTARPKSPPIPTLQKIGVQDIDFEMTTKSGAPPIPTLRQSSTEDLMGPPPLPPARRSKSPPIPTIMKRAPLHPFTNPAALDILSAKEKTQSNAADEKDIFVDKFAPSPLDDMFIPPKDLTVFVGDANAAAAPQQEFTDADFQCGSNIILNPSDFDFLLTKGNDNVEVDRSSLLIRFDPLLGVPVPVNQPLKQQQQLQQLLNNQTNNICLSPTFEEDEQQSENNNTHIVETKRKTLDSESKVDHLKETQKQQQAAKAKKHARMSVDVIQDMNIENDCNKSFENSNTQSDEKQNKYKMDDLEKKIKNEVLKTEDIEKKLKEGEQREEALIKRITEKDKTISKMNGVIESYEKTIAELVREKEQLMQNYEKQMSEIKSDRDSNYHHLTSLETTFSDLHVKYEKSKEMTAQLKASEETLLAEKRQNLDNLRLQEQRYEKMKNHAMQQLEIANKKLESLTKDHAVESTKLKALLKKEEISRASINEQLQQKSRENAELVKICDELINGQGS